MRATGTVLAVTFDQLGGWLSADAATGDGVIFVSDTSDFDETGGTLILGDTQHVYTAVDDETGQTTLDDTLGTDHTLDAPVYLWDTLTGQPSQECRADVQVPGLTDPGDAINARVSVAVASLLPLGLRDPGTGEAVVLELQDGEWVVIDLPGRRPTPTPEFASPVVTGDSSGADSTSITSTATGAGSSVASGDDSIAVGNGAAAGRMCIAVGSGAAADGSGDSSIAIGEDADATQISAVAIGQGTVAGHSSTAVGPGASASAITAVAVGSAAQATADDAIAVGDGATASGLNSIAVGESASAHQADDIVIGHGAANVTGTGAVLIGTSTSGGANDVVSIGTGAGAAGTSAVAIGKGSTATDVSAVAVGDGSGAEAAESVVIGRNALVTALGTSGVAIGQDAENNDSPDGIAIGHNADVGSGAAAAIAFGANTIAADDGAVAIGCDHTGAGAQANNADDFTLGTANHHVQVPGRLNVGRITPSGSADTQGSVGDITSDDNYVYVKTSAGWKRSALSTF